MCRHFKRSPAVAVCGSPMPSQLFAAEAVPSVAEACLATNMSQQGILTAGAAKPTPINSKIKTS
ncbi:MAG: hypothetical protein ACRYGF_18830 [Janthinobacterium lividum]